MIYLDHAAATPVSPKAMAAMTPYFSELFFNPSAPYLPAKHVREAYEAAKAAIAHAIGAKGTDLIITAGATESINLAFTAIRDFSSQKNTAPKVLVLATEHAAVLETAKSYPYELIAVDHNGLIRFDDLRAKLTDDVAFLSVSLANNELGTIQPLAEIAEILRTVRTDRQLRGIRTPLYFHTDASQAANLIDLSVARLGVDLLTLNAAKCGGPKGVGALYVDRHVRLQPLTHGGGQERGLRSGTENVPGVIGFASALSEVKAHLAKHRREYEAMSRKFRQILAQPSIVSQIPEKVKHKLKIPPEIPLFLGSDKHQLANFAPVSFPGLDAERLIYRLEEQGIYLSTGAACAANKGSKSHVLAAIGLSDAEIAGSLRITFGSTNSPSDAETAAKLLRSEVIREYERLAR